MRQYLLDSAVLSPYLRGRTAALALAQQWVHAGQATTRPSSCHASSPQSVRTTVPSGFVRSCASESSVLTSTVRCASGARDTPAAWSAGLMPGRSLVDAPEKRWLSACRLASQPHGDSAGTLASRFVPPRCRLTAKGDARDALLAHLKDAVSVHSGAGVRTLLFA
jgi:hypothetical protein